MFAGKDKGSYLRRRVCARATVMLLKQRAAEAARLGSPPPSNIGQGEDELQVEEVDSRPGTPSSPVPSPAPARACGRARMAVHVMAQKMVFVDLEASSQEQLEAVYLDKVATVMVFRPEAAAPAMSPIEAPLVSVMFACEHPQQGSGMGCHVLRTRSADEAALLCSMIRAAVTASNHSLRKRQLHLPAGSRLGRNAFLTSPTESNTKDNLFATPSLPSSPRSSMSGSPNTTHPVLPRFVDKPVSMPRSPLSSPKRASVAGAAESESNAGAPLDGTQPAADCETPAPVAVSPASLRRRSEVFDNSAQPVPGRRPSHTSVGSTSTSGMGNSRRLSNGIPSSEATAPVTFAKDATSPGRNSMANGRKASKISVKPAEAMPDRSSLSTAGSVC